MSDTFFDKLIDEAKPEMPNSENTVTKTAVKSKAKSDDGDGPVKKKRAKVVRLNTGPDEYTPYIVANIGTKSYQDMEDESVKVFGEFITKQRFMTWNQELKARGRQKAIKDAEDAGIEAYEKKPRNITNKETGLKETKYYYDYDKPITDLAKKTEEYIESNLSRPKDTRPGNSKNKEALDAQVDELFNF